MSDLDCCVWGVLLAIGLIAIPYVISYVAYVIGVSV